MKTKFIKKRLIKKLKKKIVFMILFLANIVITDNQLSSIPKLSLNKSLNNMQKDLNRNIVPLINKYLNLLNKKNR